MVLVLNKNNRIKISLRQKTILVIFGLFLTTIILETGLRLGGFIILSLQERRNLLSIRQRGEYRIMCLGDSTTACGGSGAYPYQLEKILNQRHTGIKFSVINKGVRGISSSAIVTQLGGNLNKYNPDMVIVMMGANNSSEHLPYTYTTTSKTALFLKNFRTYKLISLLWLHIVTKLKETGIYRPKEDKGLAIPTPVEESFKKAIELDPRDDRAYIELGWIYRNQAKYSQAEEAFQKAIELNPGNDAAYFDLGQFYIEVNNNSQAEESFKRAIELNPGNDAAYFDLGKIYRNQAKYSQIEEPYKKIKDSQAEESFKRAIELNPENVVAYIYLGLQYLEEKKFLEVEELFKRAIELNPRNDRLYAALAVAYQAIGKYESAQEYYQKANELRLGYYNPVTRNNYLKLKEILDKKGIKMVCVQYPVRSVAPLRKIFEGQAGVVFVDNERVFKEALNKASYKEYFIDNFAGDFGHCAPKGYRLLAENIAHAISREVFHK